MELKSLNFLSKWLTVRGAVIASSMYGGWRKCRQRQFANKRLLQMTLRFSRYTNSSGGNMRNTKMGQGAVRIVQIRAPEGAAFIQRERTSPEWREWIQSPAPTRADRDPIYKRSADRSGRFIKQQTSLGINHLPSHGINCLHLQKKS